MASLTRKEGYLLIDHRNSPGVPEADAVKCGLDPVQLRAGKLLEQATLRCEHCAGVYLKNPERTKQRAYCMSCDGYICDSCDGKRHAPDYIHAGFEKLADTWETASQRGITLGNSLAALENPKIFVP